MAVRREVEAILAGARAEHRALVAALSPELRASVPVDAAGITQAIEHLGAAAGVREDLHAEQARAHRANPAVLHGRVFGRSPLSGETVLAAFAAGARVRATLLVRLAREIGGESLAAAAASGADAAADPTSAAELQELYARQEAVALHLADALDAGAGP